MTTPAPTALVTGASRGLGLALARSLAADGWGLVVDARHAADLAAAVDATERTAPLVPVVGDLTDPRHRHDLATAASSLGGLDLVVLSAGTLGPAPLPPVAELRLEDLRSTLETNVVAQVGLLQAVLPHLRPGATVVAITSDAAVEPYEGWGAYGASKAALEQVANVLGAERPDLRVLRIDPGDMATAMYAEAAPDEDLSQMASAEDRVPAIRRLVDEGFPGRRYRGPEITAPLGVA
jgi:NAD(P)-dependent dehydrogenase (short-subunit alcohol dehydrogenase family)